MTKKVEINERNFSLIEVGSVVIYNLQRYDVYDIKRGPWPCLVISAHLRKGNKIKSFNLMVDRLELELTGMIAQIRASFL